MILVCDQGSEPHTEHGMRLGLGLLALGPVPRCLSCLPWLLVSWFLSQCGQWEKMMGDSRACPPPMMTPVVTRSSPGSQAGTVNLDLGRLGLLGPGQ